MKKVLTLILALALVLSLSATAFAATDNITDTTPAGADVNAKEVHTLSATVTWETMYFVYDSGLGTWTNTDSSGVATNAETANNKVSVTNNSAVAIKVNAKYAPQTGNALDGAKAFTSAKLSHVIGEDSSAGIALSTDTPATVLASLAAKGGNSNFWLMFTTAGTGLDDEDFAKVGTLTVEIADA